VSAERVIKAMAREEISSLTIHGEKDQTDRSEVMAAFRKGTSRLLIATDVTARGIDINDVTHVINYDLPEKPENYVHRIGRTGRGFKKGLAVSFCSSEERAILSEIEELLGQKIEVIQVSKKDYKMIAGSPAALLNQSLSLSEMVEAEEKLFQKPARKKRK
jgi:ATP-dependent RNA helicase RhlE